MERWPGLTEAVRVLNELTGRLKVAWRAISSQEIAPKPLDPLQTGRPGLRELRYDIVSADRRRLLHRLRQDEVAKNEAKYKKISRKERFSQWGKRLKF